MDPVMNKEIEMNPEIETPALNRLLDTLSADERMDVMAEIARMINASYNEGYDEGYLDGTMGVIPPGGPFDVA